MAYQLTPGVWLAAQVERVRGLLLQNMKPDTEYTATDLLALCANLGLVYTPVVYGQIGTVLVADGFLTVV